MKKNLLFTALVTFFSFSANAQIDEVKRKVPLLMSMSKDNGHDTATVSIYYIEQQALTNLFERNYSGLISDLMIKPVEPRFVGTQEGRPEDEGLIYFKQNQFTCIKGEEVDQLIVTKELVKTILLRNKLDGVLPVVTIIRSPDYNCPRTGVHYLKKVEKYTDTFFLILSITDWEYQCGN